MKFDEIANSILHEEGHNRILPRLGEIVTKVDAPKNDRREYVVVGVVPQGIWIYDIVNPDFENQNAELVFSKELEGYGSEQANESTASAAIGLGPLVAKTLMDMAGGNPYLAVGYFLLFYGVIPGSFMAWLTYDMNDVKKMITRAWASIRGRTTLDPDKVEEAAVKAKALLKGPEKGKITRLVNDMKFYIEKGRMGRAQEIADVLKDLLK